MNSRERVMTALKHREPDRVPIDLGSSHNCAIHIDAYLELRKYLGIKEVYYPKFIDVVMQAVCPEEEVLKKLGIDTRGITYGAPRNWRLQFFQKGNRQLFTDEYGVVWQKPDDGYYFDLAVHPLEKATKEEVKAYYQYADPDDPGRYEGLVEEAQELFTETNCAIVADIRAGSVIEGVWFMTGMPRFLTGMIEEPETIKILADRCNEIQKKMTEKMIKKIGKYITVIAANGDLGMENSLLVSPRLYRKFLKPYEKNFYFFVKHLTSVPVIRHSCGSISELIPDFIECGIDGINPVQVSSSEMDTRVLKEKYGDKIVFWGGGCDTQKVLPFGSPTEVRAEVRRRIRDLAPGGGFIFNAVHNIQPEVPPQNICAMFDAVREFGQYPIR